MRAGLCCLYFTQCYCFWIRFKRQRYTISYTKNIRVRWHGDRAYLISQGISNSSGNTYEIRKRISLYKNMLYQLSSSFTSAIHSSYSAWIRLHNKAECFTFLCGCSLFYMHICIFKKNSTSVYIYVCTILECYFEHALVQSFHRNTMHTWNIIYIRWFNCS